MSKKETKSLRMKADLPNLLDMAAKEIGNPGITIGFALSAAALRNVAKRAIELRDKTLITELDTIGIIKITETPEEFNAWCKTKEKGRFSPKIQLAKTVRSA